MLWAEGYAGLTTICGRNLESGREFVAATLDTAAKNAYKVSLDFSGDLAVWTDGRSVRVLRLMPEWLATE